MEKFLDRVFKALCSLRLAVIVILALAAALATGTILESLYDTPTARFWVYHSLWFHGLLFMLGLNIFSVALSRLPWKRRHIPFLLAHAGILLMLVGALLTERFGLDGSLRLAEGDSSGAVEIDSNMLYLTEGSGDTPMTYEVQVPWAPSSKLFRPITLDHGAVRFPLKIDQLIPHAEAETKFVANQDGAPAVRVEITGGPMKIQQDLWLWGGDPSAAQVRAGPAQFFLLTDKHPYDAKEMDRMQGPWLAFSVTADGKLVYHAMSKTGAKKSGVAKAGDSIDTGWNVVTLKLMDFFPHATSDVRYFPSRMDSGAEAPPSAIHLTANGGSQLWLGLGDRAVLSIPGKASGSPTRHIEVAYMVKQEILPFALKLERFSIDRYQGTLDPASYWSRVSVVDSNAPAKPVVISMNKPLVWKGYTFYQASYEEPQGGDPNARPTVSIFSVNQDPGRWMKYLGSIMLVFGIILFSASKYTQLTWLRRWLGMTADSRATEAQSPATQPEEART